MATPPFPNCLILWIEDQHEEYDPLFEDLQGLVGPEHVVVARTEEDGYAQLRDRTFALLLLDLMLPENEEERKLDLIHLEAGGRVLRELRQNLDWATPRNCGVVVLTARGNQSALAEIESLLSYQGCLITKPAPVEIIVQVVREMLEKAGRGNEK